MKPIYTLGYCLLLLLGMPAMADVSRDEAASAAQQGSGGRVLSVERTDHAGRPAWRVKLLSGQGEVRIILIDMASGRRL